jgi:hypothetical protein
LEVDGWIFITPSGLPCGAQLHVQFKFKQQNGELGSMYVTESLINAIQAAPLQGTLGLLDDLLSRLQGAPDEPNWSSADGPNWTSVDAQILRETYALLLEVHELGLFNPQLFSIRDDLEPDHLSMIYSSITGVQDLLRKENSKAQFSQIRGQFRRVLGNGFVYEFSQGDVDAIQNILNKLRELVTQSDRFDEDHRRRLLGRLEKLQSEFHKKMSDLDRFWGLIGDASMLMAKIGNDAKPIVDRIRELADIVWRTQSRAEELPSGTTNPILTIEKNGAGGDV